MLMGYASQHGPPTRRTRVHLIFYHLVWTPEPRTALLVGEIERECRALIQTVAAVHATNGS